MAGKYLRPERFEGGPTADESQWLHWFRTFEAFLNKSEIPDSDKLDTLINHISSNVYQYISDCNDYTSAVSALKNVYIKPVNKLFARYKLASRRQQGHESLEQFLQSLKLMSKECSFTALTKDARSQEAILDAFVAGISSSTIRQRLLENDHLTLDSAVQQALSLDLAQRNAGIYSGSSIVAAVNNTATYSSQNEQESGPDTIYETSQNLAYTKSKCFFCGRQSHHRSKCPAREAVCRKCSKVGHFAGVCRSSIKRPTTTASMDCSPQDLPSGLSATNSFLAAMDKSPKQITCAKVNGVTVGVMVDSGSSGSFFKLSRARAIGLPIYPSCEEITMAASNLSSTTAGHTSINVELDGHRYENYTVNLLPNLCTDLILGRDFMNEHQSVEFHCSGSLPKLSLCAFSQMKIKPPSVFANLLPDCKPIRVPSRRYNDNDKQFISVEVKRLLQEGIIEKSSSPWRAQVLVAGGGAHKRRLVIDYSQTINRFTLLDAYPLPNINDLVQELAQNNFFSKVDLRSAYHQIPLRRDERQFTAFEADGELFQFVVLPFGLTNAVAVFQREMKNFVRRNNLQKVYIYLDDIIIGGETMEEHNSNLESFLTAAALENMTLNQEKCKYGFTQITYLGHCISSGQIQPDPERLRPLRDMPVPNDPKSLRRCLGLFSYYAKWVASYSDKISSLLSATTFPLTETQQKSFKSIIQDICSAAIAPIDTSVPFEVETDASDVAVAATLSQCGRPVAFFSRTLHASEKKHPAIEKEALAIVEAVRHWRHYLAPKRFVITTDQRAVSFMFDLRHGSRIKNDKVARWRIELSSYQYDINYRPGKENLSADALSRVCAVVSRPVQIEELKRLHEALCHPGITRLNHFVKAKNLPYSLDDVRKVCLACPACASIKPRYYNSPKFSLVQSTRPFERVSVDFMGPKTSASRNKYLFVMIDEYSRFPFAFPCPDASSDSAIKCCQQVFSTFGCPSSVHSDRAQCFKSSDFKEFMLQNGVLLTHTTPYHPTGNSQCERLNGTLWKAIKLALTSSNLPDTKWEQVLPTALHSIRSLLCVATNATPHERIFRHSRRSFNGFSLPTWLSKPGTVLLKKYVRLCKSDPLVVPVQLLEANPSFSYVKFPDGRESTVSTGDLADPGELIYSTLDTAPNTTLLSDPTTTTKELELPENPESAIQNSPPIQSSPACSDFEGFDNAGPSPSLLTKIREPEMNVRRSLRIRRSPDRLTY